MAASALFLALGPREVGVFVSDSTVRIQGTSTIDAMLVCVRTRYSVLRVVPLRYKARALPVLNVGSGLN